jgi:uncharacterized protein (TIGR02594 family)
MIDADPVWLAIARAEMARSVKEIAGDEHNQRIVLYHSFTTLKATEDEVPWCSSFVNFCFADCEISGTNSAAARSWLNWGMDILYPALGCVAILERGATGGHVGFYLGTSDAGETRLLAGNQSDRVCIQTFDPGRVLGYRWPA